MTNFFNGPVDPSKWRPLRRGEPGYDKRQYVRASIKRATPKTQRISLRRFQTAVGGRTLEERARANPKGRTEAQREAFRIKRKATADKKLSYGKKNPETIGEIRKLEKMKSEFAAGKKLSKKERAWAAYKSFRHPDLHEDFLALLYPDGIPSKTKRRRGSKSKETIMRDADRARRKAA
jgi:hypothetical protein